MIQVKTIILVIAVLISGGATCQTYFQQRVDHEIEVRLIDSSKTLSGFQKIVYINNSPDTLDYIWFHLWPNAFANDQTAFSKQLLENGRTDFYFSAEKERGYISQLNFSVDGKQAFLESDSTFLDKAKLVLPLPLLPNDSIEITTPFIVKLPRNFSRGGYTERAFQITQWYPKPAVYDREGWHPMPYLDQGEFYNEFGNYHVRITVPQVYQVAAAGMQEGEPVITEGEKTVSFHLANALDFAWFASPDFVLQQDTMQLADGRIIDVEAWYSKESTGVWKNATALMKHAIQFYSAALGIYPYPSVKAVEANMGFAGGMEYPTITCISGVEDEKSLDLLLAHEIGHNWFYGILASNERANPWMDEGMNSYFENEYRKQRYGQSAHGKLPEDFLDLGYRIAIREKSDQPIASPAAELSNKNYSYIAYHKAALWVQKLHDELGSSVFDRVMKTYFDRWKFRHPAPADFKEIVQEVSGKNFETIFNALKRSGPLEASRKKKFRLSGIGSLRKTDQFNYLFISPAVGLNSYDKVMAGLLVHNYTLPEPAFHFFAAPMFGFNSKSFTGIGRAGYSLTSYGFIRKTEVALAAAHFNVNSFTDDQGKVTFMPFTKFVPTVKLIFRNKNPRSQTESSLQWKTFLITETGISFTVDTVVNRDIISYPREQRSLHQLTFSFANKRTLYPYSAMLRGETGKGFGRLTFDGNYRFNYPKGDGLDVRLFAGKFFYLHSETPLQRYQTSRYHLNMTGANGYEDYTYSNYFVGRNRFEGAASQQIMIRDGGFKMRTDLLNRKVGRSDDWLMALNLNTPLPDVINPLQVLPFKVPLKIFADAGTYAEAWKKDAPTGKFIYDAGLQISLLKNLVNIYIPLIYSEVYANYLKSAVPPGERFWKKISFSIDLQRFDFRELLNKNGL